MSPEETERRVKEMVVDRLLLNAAPESVPTESSLVETYHLDSVRLIELAAGLEEYFGIRLGDQTFDLRIFRSVASICDFVRTHTPSRERE